MTQRLWRTPELVQHVDREGIGRRLGRPLVVAIDDERRTAFLDIGGRKPGVWVMLTIPWLCEPPGTPLLSLPRSMS